MMKAWLGQEKKTSAFFELLVHLKKKKITSIAHELKCFNHFTILCLITTYSAKVSHLKILELF